MAYEIEDAFKAIEDELIDSMIRNMKHHRAEELREGFEWTSWQTLQLNALREYSANNRKKFTKQFADINAKIEEGIRQSRLTGNMDAEIEILEAIKKGFKASKVAPGMQAEFFRVNDRKLDALIEATKKDMQKAEHAMLRMADDQYRQVIFNAQVYANTGAGTYEKAVDMATKDYLSRGINCIQYKNGARVDIASYAAMAIRTANTRAYLTGEGEKRREWGISTVIVNKRGHACLRCLKWTGRVLIDDVWSGGKKEDGDYPLMSTAMEQGLYHPNCKDIHTTFFPGITKEPKPLTRQEVEDSKADYKREQEQGILNLTHDRLMRCAKYSLDEENQRNYEDKALAIEKRLFRNAHMKTEGEPYKRHNISQKNEKTFKPLPKERVVEILRKESESWIATLTEQEKKSIHKYTYNSGDKKPNRFFERLNAMLRGDLPKRDSIMHHADLISSAIEKNKLNHDIICYRNMDIDIYHEFNVGDIFESNQFISTSVVQSGALNKEYKVIICVPKGSRGAYIEKISKYPKQREFLLDKGCKYRILSNKEKEIVLEVIG